jgi:hypothetical protein
MVDLYTFDVLFESVVVHTLLVLEHTVSGAEHGG